LQEIENVLVKNYQLRIVLSDCNPSSLKVNALVDLSDDISELLPYLNTVLKGRQYNEEEKSLTVKRGGHLITFWPQQIAITKLEDENEARILMEELKEAVNKTHTNREHIRPTFTSRPIPKPLDIFKLLPGNNCKECEEPTCMAFALKLVNDDIGWKRCPLLLTKEFETNRLKLMSVLPESEE
jgi:ArsR family metal-binding transcriptional regulator